MDEVWCGLDLQLQAGDIEGLHPAPDLHGHDDPFWPALAECAASFLAGDDTARCFGVADIDLTAAASANASKAADYGMDTSGFFADDNDHRRLMTMRQDEQQQPVYSSSSLSSKRSLSIDSGGSSSTFFPLDDAAAALPAAIFSPPHAAPLPPAPPVEQQQDPFAGDDEAIMLAMMAVLSSASPSSSESSSPPHRAAAAVQPRLHLHRGDSASHVTVRSSSLAVAPERTTSAAARQQQQQQQDSNNSSQVHHMMSERKRREKLNDSFHTLRSLLPPCSKKDKTTVLMNAASYLKTLEAQVLELEEKNTKLERYVPREDAGTTATAAHRRAKVHISRAASDEQQVSLTVMVMVECDIVDLVLHVLERLRWMSGVSVLSVDADTYSPQALLKALANIKLHIMDGDCWNEGLFHEAMTKAVHDATSSSSSPASCAAVAPLVAAA
ncbi:unnamed protein product [Miscanthus lutarioriparius]|uniref:BHLH domain-containing protein n=1 Tax=Miscanthus lutarioriparius TaxID=422564 RepID=A0A811P2Q8_9POAL|nr:unnamed protein product [Miscanthus lutarioriparius]